MQSVSIIIPAWNEAESLKPTLDALTQIEYDRSQVEVIVVGGGDDNTYEIAKGLLESAKTFSRYIVVFQGNKGTKNSAVQQGMAEARSDIIVLLDADTIVSRQWLKRLTEPIKEGSCDLTIANSEPVKKNWVSDYYMIIKTYYVDRITTYPGHSLAFKASIVKGRTKEFFDENVWMGDDYVFEKKVAEEGRKILFVKNADVKTHFPWSLTYFWKIESQWLTASIHMNGLRYGTLLRNVIFIGSLVCLFPFWKPSFMLALLFNAFYIGRRVHMFRGASRQYETRPSRLVGFVMLSYIHHILVFISHVRFFLGRWKDPYYQGQRC